MRSTAEEDPYSGGRPDPPVMSDTQMWIEIAYLDSHLDFRDALLERHVSPGKKGEKKAAWKWTVTLLFVALVILAALWVGR